MEVKTVAEIKFEIKETVGSLSQSPKGWSKELNLISWNGKEPKFDLRDWAPEHEKMGKGVTLSVEELKTLRDLLNGMEL
nr:MULTISPECIES: YdbC family protein [Bacillaceae]